MIKFAQFRSYVAVAVLAITALVSASQAKAQNLNVKVNMPYAFEVGDTHFEAGQYTLRMPNGHMISLEGKQNALAIANWNTTGATASATKVVLHKVGDRYYLSQVVVAGRADVLQTLKSKAEKQAEKADRNTQIASGAAADVTVEAFN